MAEASSTPHASHDQSSNQFAASAARRAGALLALGATTFFVGSALITQAEQPGASTPAPWLASHAMWALASGVVTAGALATVRAKRPAAPSLPGSLAVGSLGLATLHALQWLGWTYLDVFAYRHGEHDLLHPTLLHPYGTAQAMLYAIVLGAGVALFAWHLVRTDATRRVVAGVGLVIGPLGVVTGSTATLGVLDVPHPVVLAGVLSIAASFAWLLAVGISGYRDA